MWQILTKNVAFSQHSSNHQNKKKSVKSKCFEMSSQFLRFSSASSQLIDEFSFFEELLLVQSFWKRLHCFEICLFLALFS